MMWQNVAWITCSVQAVHLLCVPASLSIVVGFGRSNFVVGCGRSNFTRVVTKVKELNMEAECMDTCHVGIMNGRGLCNTINGNSGGVMSIPRGQSLKTDAEYRALCTDPLEFPTVPLGSAML